MYIATIGVSNRHAHLSKEDAERLGLDPKPVKYLGIKGQYKSDCYVQCGRLRFPVLLPFRNQSQLEVLASDCRELGIPVECRYSGDTEGAPLLNVHGSVMNEVYIDIPAIVAKRHVHVPGDWPREWVEVTILGTRGEFTVDAVPMLPFDGCEVPVLHIDRDEAVAFGVEGGELARITPKGE